MKWLNIFIESLVIFLILFSPLVYAGNRPIPITIIESLSFLLLFVFLLRESLQGRLVLVKAPVLALIAFIGLIIFQLIPLPAAVLSAISPNTFTLYKDFFLGPLQNLTLSIYPEATTSLLLQLLSYLAAFFVILNYVDNEEKGRRIIFTIIISGSLYALYGLLRKLVTPIGLFSTFGNRDHFAAYMEMIIPLCISYVFIESSRTKKAVIVFLASIMSLALVLSLCRAGIICFSLSLLLFIFLFRLKRPLKKGLIVGLAFILVLGLFLAAIGTETVTKRLDTLRNPLKAMTGRAEVLQNSPPIIADFPVFGTGFNTFGDIFRKYEVVKANVLRFAHNEPLQLIIETGFIGFLLVFCFLLFYFRHVLLVWLKRKHPYPVYITLGCITGLVSASLHSFFDFFFHIPAVALLFFIILALMFRVVYTRGSQSILLVPQRELSLSRSLNLIFIGIFCFLFLLVESVIFNRYQAEAAFRRGAGTEISGTGIEAAIQINRSLREINEAIGLNPLNSRYVAFKAGLLYRAATRKDAKDVFSGRIEGIEYPIGALSFSERLYTQAINLNPTNADYHFGLGKVYRARGKIDLASKEFADVPILNLQNNKY